MSIPFLRRLVWGLIDFICTGAVAQGMGGGSIYAMSHIITSDLVPLAERPTYQSALVMVYALAAGIGPVMVSLANLMHVSNR